MNRLAINPLLNEEHYRFTRKRERLYQRKREVEKIIGSLSNGNNLQITAPRRVGKTSILWYLLDNDFPRRQQKVVK